MQIFLVALAVGLIATFGVGAVGGFGAGFVAFLIWIGAVLVLGWVLSAVATRQVTLGTSASVGLVMETILDEFGTFGWKRVDGRGALNFKPRGFGMSAATLKKPVVSIDVERVDDGITQVDIWMSQWSTQGGIVGFCDRVVTKVWLLQRRVVQLEADMRSDAQ
ncbi:hypothetical protein [Nocardia vaccinii]|uniref:hypothetical protein n=1 Tax=Nocardia vaccinii TaxID=1822 RepID=UPI0012F4E494|nr:hypothetical protein [Nocardia vaccinii]